MPRPPSSSNQWPAPLPRSRWTSQPAQASRLGRVFFGLVMDKKTERVTRQDEENDNVAMR